jgi:hypothetical protein
MKLFIRTFVRMTIPSRSPDGKIIPASVCERCYRCSCVRQSHLASSQAELNYSPIDLMLVRPEGRTPRGILKKSRNISYSAEQGDQRDASEGRTGSSIHEILCIMCPLIPVTQYDFYESPTVPHAHCITI